MAPTSSSSCPKKLLFIYVLFIFLTSTLISVSSQHQNPNSHQLYGKRRMLLELEDDDDNEPIIKKKSSSTSSSSTSGSTKISNNNQTKLIKPVSTSSKNQTKITKTSGGSLKNQTSGSSSKNQTKLIKLPSDSLKNKTKPIKPTSNSLIQDSSLKSQIKKLNSTSKSSSNSTPKTTSLITKKPSDLTSSKNKTTTTKDIKAQLQNKPKPNKPQQPSWLDDEVDDDLMSEIRDLPSKFQETFVPDLEKFSKSSQLYINKYNKEFTRGFKPYVGNKYASTIASIVCFAFIIIPLILVSLIFNKIKAYFSLLKLLIFIQVYLAIYFTILCLSSLATGLEPLKFFYSTSQSTYVCVQVLQTLAYVLYLLLLLMYLILVFSTETGLATKLLGLGQTFVGFAVGLHYYVMVFHRAVLHHPPKTSWKVHAVYATCFLAICLLGNADRRKKAYLEEGGEEGKKS